MAADYDLLGASLLGPFTDGPTAAAPALDREGSEARMKNFDSRAYSINDFREWDAHDQLVLSPRFQRRSVWSETARSYLMDTIVRGKPIPKIFIRQKIDPASGRSIREVVDGQQRLRTILSYISDGFVIRTVHNRDVGGLYFSQLPDDVRVRILSYEISTDLLINVSDAEVLDIFARLNSYAVVLNQQEKINASHFGPFKQLADDLAHEYFEYWVANGILRDAQVLRMQDVALAADLLIAMCDGIQGKKQVSAYYKIYEDEFPFDGDQIAREFHATMQAIAAILPDGLKRSEFRRVHLFYSLFTAIYHLKFGLRGLDDGQAGAWERLNPSQVRSSWDRIELIFDAEDPAELVPEDRRFLNDSRRATTDTSVRERRTQYLVDLATSR